MDIIAIDIKRTDCDNKTPIIFIDFVKYFIKLNIHVTWIYANLLEFSKNLLQNIAQCILVYADISQDRNRIMFNLDVEIAL